ncbi:FAD-binding protein, partial [Streptomyces rochei]|nr:FAD-binding protein [Streptomyces rochei]
STEPGPTGGADGGDDSANGGPTEGDDGGDTTGAGGGDPETGTIAGLPTGPGRERQ